MGVARPRSAPLRGSVSVLLAVGAVVLLLPFGPWASSPRGAPHAPSTPETAHPRSLATSTAPSLAPTTIRPGVSGAYDWDPQPLNQPSNVSSFAIAGEGAAMATLDRLGTVVLFGGFTLVGLTNLTLSVNETTGLWTNVTRPVAPSPRANFSFAANSAKGYIVLFGGLTDLGTQAVSNQTWVFYVRNSTWVNVTTPNSPPARESGGFAIDPSAGLGLLQGGWNPSVQVGNSHGFVIWNDTWALNLTTFRWGQLHPSKAPSPREGSGLTWSPSPAEFLLFGGCGTGCANDLWSFVPPSGPWRSMSVSGDTAPVAREGATFVWEGQASGALLFGGDAPAAGSLLTYDDSFLAVPVSATSAVWVQLTSPAVPPARYAAPAAYLGANGCPGVFLGGGSYAIATPPTDGWFLDSNPDVTQGCNVWGGDSVDQGKGSGGGGPCAPGANLTVSIVDRFRPILLPNASVTANGGRCGVVTLPTGPNGLAVFTNLSHTTYDISVVRLGYHPNATRANLSGPANVSVIVPLTPLPNLVVRTLGNELNAVGAPLAGVTITLDDEILPVGTTDSGGWLNVTGLNRPGTELQVAGSLAGFSTASRFVPLPYTGTTWANLTLLADGLFTVVVRVAGTTVPVVGAVGVIAETDPGNGFVPLGYGTDAHGTFTALLPIGNYSVTANAAGFLPNRTGQPVFHPWISATTVTINLSLVYGSNLSVRLLNAATHAPIGNGTVALGESFSKQTNAAGWANFSDVLPIGTYAVIGTAVGFEQNETIVRLAYQGHPPPVLLNLTPIPGCGKGAQCGLTNGSSNPPFALLPAGGSTLAVLLALPFVLLLGGAAYALWARRRDEPGGPGQPVGART